MLRDELEQSELRELERAKKEKTFLMSLSHDIKTPLSAIKRSTQKRNIQSIKETD